MYNALHLFKGFKPPSLNNFSCIVYDFTQACKTIASHIATKASKTTASIDATQECKTIASIDATQACKTTA